MGFARLPRERRHTLYFLRWSRFAAPVHLDTEVEMSRITQHRESRRAAGTRYSVVSYVLLAAGRVLAAHPEANSLVRGGLVPRVHTPGAVHGKLALDKRVGGRRIVLATVVPDLQTAALDDIQRLHVGDDVVRAVGRVRREVLLAVPEVVVGALGEPLDLVGRDGKPHVSTHGQEAMSGAWEPRG
jgi:hypothetical protein